jgi:hypothetical protein
MASIILLASFPNSRIESRSPTKTADTFGITISPFAGLPTLVLSADENRTYTKMQETTSPTPFGFGYFYATTANVNPNITPTFGIQYDLLYNNVSTNLYQKQDDGVTTNWSLIVPSLIAFKSVAWLVEPVSATMGGNVTGIESLQDIYVFSLNTGGAVALDVEFGEG